MTQGRFLWGALSHTHMHMGEVMLAEILQQPCLSYCNKEDAASGVESLGLGSLPST